ncbi:hypothetical protein EDB92DRAFT_1820083 [Lactarius akahatsu]|uniref:Uncharacterized protein n=1 Tax=Lactarius akahatsu TaxID=416441 RepID=A0AAD4LCS3_9AGAM|nr:hypothetical protein EDB92DRAFT_1820083 [Lactarius akahatsu]
MTTAAPEVQRMTHTIFPIETSNCMMTTIPVSPLSADGGEDSNAGSIGAADNHAGTTFRVKQSGALICSLPTQHPLVLLHHTMPRGHVVLDRGSFIHKSDMVNPNRFRPRPDPLAKKRRTTTTRIEQGTALHISLAVFGSIVCVPSRTPIILHIYMIYYAEQSAQCVAWKQIVDVGNTEAFTTEMLGLAAQYEVKAHARLNSKTRLLNHISHLLISPNLVSSAEQPRRR